MSKKYMLHPGLVRSRTDGQEHYITADRLAELYRVPKAECITVTEDYLSATWDRDLIHLYPRSDGRYAVPGRTMITNSTVEAKTGQLSATYHVDTYYELRAHVAQPHTESRYAEERVRRMVQDKILEILSDGRTYTVTIAPRVAVRRDDRPPYPRVFTQYAYVWIALDQCEVGEHVAPGTFPDNPGHYIEIGNLRFVRNRHGWCRTSF